MSAEAKTALELRWSRHELEPVFGPLNGRKAWHRLEERVSKLNRQGRLCGVRVNAAREDEALSLAARDGEGLDRFRRGLDAASGRVQRAFGRMIADGLADGGPGALGECLARQRGEVVRLAREPLRLFAELAPLSGSVFIDPPFRSISGPAKTRNAVEEILAEVSSPGGRSVLVYGPSGVGKSTLSGEVFRRLQAAPGAGWSHPIFVPAATVRQAQSGGVDWEAVPGVPAGLGGRFETLFKEGRLLIFLDGLDENLRLTDLSDPAVWSFWGMASRNRCVLTCRDRFYNYRFVCSPIERIFAGTLRVLELPCWTPKEAKALYAAIMERGRGVAPARRIVDGLGHLSRLAPEVLQEKMASFSITGLSAWNFAIYFTLHNGGKFPRNEYEILEYFVEQALRWEKGKAREAEPLPIEVLRGLLVRLGRNADGERNGRKSWRIVPEAILEVAGRYYPFLLERKKDLFAALREIPFLTYQGDTGAFHLDYRLGCFFAAKNLVSMGLQGDVERLREECQAPISFQTFSFLLQAFSGFDDEAKRIYFATSKSVFEESARLYAHDPAAQHAKCMYEMLEPLGNLGWPPADDFLRGVAARPRDYPELVNLGAARAVAYAGDHCGVDAYIRRLKRDKGARQTNRNYYLHWIWLANEYARAETSDGIAPPSPEAWDRIARWFVQKLTTSDYKALRHIQLFTFIDLLQTFGRGNLERGALRAVAESLRRESSGWSRDARADLAAFDRLVSRLDRD